MKVGEITRCFRCSPSISPTVTSEQRLPGGLLLRLLVLPRAISPLSVLLSLVLKHAQLLPSSGLSWLCSSCLQDSGQSRPQGSVQGSGRDSIFLLLSRLRPSWHFLFTTSSSPLSIPGPQEKFHQVEEKFLASSHLQGKNCNPNFNSVETTTLAQEWMQTL